MMKIKKGKRSITAVFVMVLSWQLAACGTIFFPEQRGQTSGQIDPKVAILDGIGILFFIVPGVIAFAVDFVTGAIYLPGGKKASLEEHSIDNVTAIPVERGNLTVSDIQDAVKRYQGVDVNLNAGDVSMIRVSDAQSAKAMILAFNQASFNDKAVEYLSIR